MSVFNRIAGLRALRPFQARRGGGRGTVAEQVLASTDLRSSVTQYGITWTFDDSYPVGQFVNGDYFVLPQGETYPTVSSVSPAPAGSGENARNGSMLNAYGTSTKGNAYDGRTSDYDASLATSFPLELSAGDSLLSAESQAEDWPLGYAETKTVAILTCLATAPYADAFRPHYGPNNATKVMHRTSDLLTDRLTNLTVAGTPPPMSELEDAFERPWVDHYDGHLASNSAPWTNYLRDGDPQAYGRERSRTVGDAMLLLCSDESTVGDKTTLLNRFVQVGIDTYGLRVNGFEVGTAGGHLSGRKAPILFAGHLLDNQDMLDIGTDYVSTVGGSTPFQEDGQTAYVSQAVIDATLNCELTGTVSSATTTTITFDQDTARHVVQGSKVEITAGTGSGQIREVSSMNESTETATLTEAWTTIPDGTSTYKMLGYEQSHLDMPEWSGNFAVGWASAANPAWGHYYRDVVGQGWCGQMLGVLILGLKDTWNHEAWFDYVDRYMNVMASTGSGDGYGYHYPDQNHRRSNSDFAEAMWDEYRSSY